MGTVLDNAASTFYFLPEIVLTVGAMLVFLLDLGVAKHPRRMAILSWVSIAVLGVATWATWYVAHSPYAAPDGSFTPLDRPVALFHGLIVLDSWAIFFKYLSWIVTALCIWIAEPSLEVGSDRIGEYCALLLAIAVGMSLMASSTDMLMMAIGVELVSMVS